MQIADRWVEGRGISYALPPLEVGAGPCSGTRRNSTPPSTDASWQTPHHSRMILEKVLDERWVQDAAPGNPGALLRTVPLPIDEVLVTPPTAPHIQELTDRPGWMIIDHPRRRRRRDGRGQRLVETGLI